MLTMDRGSEVVTSLVVAAQTLGFPEGEVAVRRLPEYESVIVSKPSAGFGRASVEAFSDALEAALDENPKFLVFDFAHQAGADEEAPAPDSFCALIHANANLIAQSSTVSVAWARGEIAGADLEFVLSCSMIAAEARARFTLSPYGGAYAFLARKIGVARAERAMLDRDVLDAAAMRDMLLVRHVEEENFDGRDNCADAAVENFLARSLRRHNALSFMYRAQRLVMPAPYEMIRAARGV